MIFVTVGTHEQQFNRLIQCVDDLKRDGVITEDVFIQTGFSTYIPKYCEHKNAIPYSEVVNNIKKARIVITHGGPSSFIMSLQFGKIPIVVPRQKKFGEHVNDHQVNFCTKFEKQRNNIIVINDIEELSNAISNYDAITKVMNDYVVDKNEKFNEELEKIISELF